MSYHTFLNILKFNGLYSELNRENVIEIVSWLENRKIRALRIEEREKLNHDNPEWDDIFREYLKIVICPYEWAIDSNDDCISWLLQYAVNLEHEDFGWFP